MCVFTDGVANHHLYGGGKLNCMKPQSDFNQRHCFILPLCNIRLIGTVSGELGPNKGVFTRGMDRTVLYVLFEESEERSGTILACRPHIVNYPK